MKTLNITPKLGIEAWPKSLTDLDPYDIWEKLAKFGVVVLRGLKHIKQEEFVQFGARMGKLELAPKPVAGFPELMAFTHDADHPPSENIWHSDMSFLPSPPIGRILRPTALPKTGGDTLFADMRWVLESLPTALRETLIGLEAEHDIAKQVPPEMREKLHARCPPITHPLICVHPVSGEQYLFCNNAYTTRVVGVSSAESEALLQILFGRTLLPEAQCRVCWDLETVLVWDNRHLQHYAVGDYFPNTRSMERLTLSSELIARCSVSASGGSDLG